MAGIELKPKGQLVLIMTDLPTLMCSYYWPTLFPSFFRSLFVCLRLNAVLAIALCFCVFCLCVCWPAVYAVLSCGYLYLNKFEFAGCLMNVCV